MITTLSLFFAKFKNYIIAIIILLGLFSYIFILNNKVSELKIENSRNKNNIVNMQFKVDTTVLANGNLKYSVNALTLKNDEIKHFSEDVYRKLNELDIKLKNVKAVTNVDYHYTTNVDTLKTQKISANKFSFELNKNNIKTNGDINVPEGYPNSPNPFISNMKIQLNDSLLIVSENIYKRRWLFWKKLTNVKLHITSSNPDFKIDRIQTLEIKE